MENAPSKNDEAFSFYSFYRLSCYKSVEVAVMAAHSDEVYQHVENYAGQRRIEHFLCSRNVAVAVHEIDDDTHQRNEERSDNSYAARTSCGGRTGGGLEQRG